MSSVKRKTRKLLNISKDHAASPHGVESCMRKVERPKREYRLSEADLPDDLEDCGEAVEDEVCVKAVIHLLSKCDKWEIQLAGFVQLSVGGVSRFMSIAESQPTEDGTSCNMSIIGFLGYPSDVGLAVELYGELHKLIKDRTVRSHRHFFCGAGPSYADGFVAGLEGELAAERLAQKRGAEEANDSGESPDLLNQPLELAQSAVPTADDLLTTPAGREVQFSGPHIPKANTASDIAFSLGLMDGVKHRVSDTRIARLSFRA